MTTLLAHHVRKAAHGLHRCGWCGGMIANRGRYIDQRIADNGTVYTWRAHCDCDFRVWQQVTEDDIEGIPPRDVWAFILEAEES